MLPSRLACVLIGFIALSPTVESQRPTLLLPSPAEHEFRIPAIRQTLLQIAVCPNTEGLHVFFQPSEQPFPVTVVHVPTKDIVDVPVLETAHLVFLDGNTTYVPVSSSLSLSFRCGLTDPANPAAVSTSDAMFNSGISPYLLEAPPIDPIRINHTVPVNESIFQLNFVDFSDVSLQRTYISCHVLMPCLLRGPDTISHISN